MYTVLYFRRSRAFSFRYKDLDTLGMQCSPRKCRLKQYTVVWWGGHQRFTAVRLGSFYGGQSGSSTIRGSSSLILENLKAGQLWSESHAAWYSSERRSSERPCVWPWPLSASASKKGVVPVIPYKVALLSEKIGTSRVVYAVACLVKSYKKYDIWAIKQVE